MAAICAPRPICSGLVPPLVAVGADPIDSVCESCVENRTSAALKPLVSALAMLLPMTAMAVSLSDSPLTDVFSADVRPIGFPPREWRVGRDRTGGENLRGSNPPAQRPPRSLVPLVIGRKTD